jgi:hypothetical protein
MRHRSHSLFSILALAVGGVLLASNVSAANHPHLLFSRADIPDIQARARNPRLAPAAKRLLERADHLLGAPPLVVSPALRGEPDAPGELKGLEAARRLQGRVLTFCMAWTLTGDRKYLDAAVAELDGADGWKTEGAGEER